MAQMLDAVIRLKNDFSSTLETVSKDVGQFSREWKTKGRSIQRTGSSLNSMGNSLTAGLTVPLLGVGVVASKLGLEFEKAGSEVKAITQATGPEMKKMQEAARKAGAVTTKSATEAMEALKYMGLAGWEVGDSMEALMPILRLSEAGNLDLGRASDLVTDSLSAMGKTVEDLPHYLDIVAQTSRKSNTDIDSLMEAYIGLGGSLRNLNVPLEESASVLGLMANAGLKGSEAGNSLSAILTNLTAPTGRAKKALDQLGYSAFDSEGNFKGLEQVLKDVNNMTKDMTQEQRQQILAMIGGKNHGEALGILLAELDENYDGLKKSITGASGALEEMAKEMQNNGLGQLARIVSGLEELALQGFEMLAPSLTVVADKIEQLVLKLQDMTPEQKEAIMQMIKMAVVIGPLLKVTGKLTSGVGKAVTEFGFFAGRLKSSGSILTALMTPGAKVALIIAGIGLAIYALYKNWNKIQAFIIGSPLPEAFEKIKTAFDPVILKIGEMKNRFSEWFEGVKPYLNAFKELIFEIFIIHVTTAIETFGEVMANVGTIIDGVIIFFQGLGDFITGFVNGDWALAWEGAKTMFDGVVQIIVAIWENAVEILTRPVTAIIKLLDNKFGEKIDGIKEKWQSVKEFLKNPITGTINLARRGLNALGIGSNATGTLNWRGGPTAVHETGGEIIDLPRGTRIYPHDKSVQMARQESSGQSIVINKLADEIIVREESDIHKVSNAVAEKLLLKLKNTSPRPV